MAFELVETVTLTAAASSIEFTSIPQDGVDLLCVFSARADSNNIQRTIDLLVNGVGTSLSAIVLEGTGIQSQSFTSTDYVGRVPGNNATANTFGSNSVYFSNYTSAANKSYSIDSVTESNVTSAQQALAAGLRSNTDAITSIGIDPGNNNLMAGSTASLYKIF